MPAQPSKRPVRRPNSALEGHWRQRFRRFELSGLSVVAFCAKEGVSEPSFYAWRRRLRPSSAEPAVRPTHPPGADARLVPVRLLPAAAPVELLLRGGGVLRLAPGCDLDFVRRLVATLGDLPC